MESTLEQQRRLHEERERLLDSMVKEMVLKKNSHREVINSDHRLKLLLDQHMESSDTLRELYEDKDGFRKEEINSIFGSEEFTEFYARLKAIKEFHRRHPNQVSVPMSIEFEELNKLREAPTDEMNNMVEFTDEEGYGKYLDLHECYEKYINLKGIDKIDYITYLSIVDHLFDISKERKNSEYRKYLELLLEYLHDYLIRTKPLFNVDQEMENLNKEFNQQWEDGTFPGWSKDTGGALTNVGAHLDLSAFSSWEELASLGLDRLKSALLALGLKCGGTLEERAERLFSTKGKTDLDPNLMIKPNVGKTRKNKNVNKQKEIAMLEAQVYKFMELLSEQRNATKENVQRKQARTEGERGDSDVEASASDTDEDEDDDIPYNPKNLPLGWDGKPIPYWLYKLHGLNISYNCEICGNFTYKGPKAFQRHFALHSSSAIWSMRWKMLHLQPTTGLVISYGFDYNFIGNPTSKEWRHAHGMRCLGIPNTAHFANVTQIEDALSLWEKIKNQKHEERWQPEHEEEFEDSLGNVVNRKTFEDLKRQGLL